MNDASGVAVDYLAIVLVDQRRFALAALTSQAEQHFDGRPYTLCDVRCEPLGDTSFAVSGHFLPVS